MGACHRGVSTVYCVCTSQCVVVPDPESDPYPVQTETFFQDPDLESDLE